jgi:hypothetical protein
VSTRSPSVGSGGSSTIPDAGTRDPYRRIARLYDRIIEPMHGLQLYVSIDSFRRTPFRQPRHTTTLRME